MTPETAKVFDAPSGKPIDTALHRQRLPILEDHGEGKARSGTPRSLPRSN